MKQDNGLIMGQIGLDADLPARALELVERERLPGQLLALRNGAFQVWRLPAFRNYYDARTIMYGPYGYFKVVTLTGLPPDVAPWDIEVARYGINTVVAPISTGRGYFRLGEWCAHSGRWAPVYLDEFNGVFVRRGALNAELTQRLEIKCEDIVLPATGADAINYAQAAVVFIRLGHYEQGLAAMRKAMELAPRSALLREAYRNQLKAAARAKPPGDD